MGACVAESGSVTLADADLARRLEVACRFGAEQARREMLAELERLGKDGLAALLRERCRWPDADTGGRDDGR